MTVRSSSAVVEKTHDDRKGDNLIDQSVEIKKEAPEISVKEATIVSFDNSAKISHG